MNKETQTIFSNNKEEKPSLFQDLIKQFTGSGINKEGLEKGEDSWFKLFKDIKDKKFDGLISRFVKLFKGILGETKKNTSILKEEIAKSSIVPLDLSQLKELEENGVKGYKEIARRLARSKGMPEDLFLQHITRENASWDPTIKNQKTGAYGLGQIIPGTWKPYKKKGLDKESPMDQLIGAISYIEKGKKKNNCSWEEALAFYNTGINFDRYSEDPVNSSYITGNLKSIVWKIPGCEGKKAQELIGKVTKKQYFIAASSYYSGRDYSDIA